MRVRKLCWAIAFLTTVAASPLSAKGTEPLGAFEQLRSLDARVLVTGYRLASANAAFCPETQYSAGFSIHNLRQYGDPETARKAFGFAGEFAVLAIVPDGPADIAGIEPDDVILEAGAVQLAPDAQDLDAIDQSPAYRAFAWGQQRINDALASPPSRFVILRNSDRQILSINPILVCQSHFEIETASNLDASADGEIVKITSAMAEFTADDDELATLLAHELAHNILAHRKRLNDAGIRRGIFQQFGRNARLTKQTEIEADRLSIWLMVNAGYDPQAAIRFWTRFGKQHGGGIFSAPTHYRWKKRVELFEQEISKIAQAPQSEHGYFPPLLATPPALLD